MLSINPIRACNTKARQTHTHTPDKTNKRPGFLLVVSILRCSWITNTAQIKFECGPSPPAPQLSRPPLELLAHFVFIGIGNGAHSPDKRRRAWNTRLCGAVAAEFAANCQEWRECGDARKNRQTWTQFNGALKKVRAFVCLYAFFFSFSAKQTPHMSDTHSTCNNVLGEWLGAKCRWRAREGPFPRNR